MTTGQLVFYSGIALLGLTIVTAVVFLIKRPKYIPENAVYESAGAGQTQQLHKSYPSEREIIRRESGVSLPPTEFLRTGEPEGEPSAAFQSDPIFRPDNTKLDVE